MVEGNQPPPNPAAVFVNNAKDRLAKAINAKHLVDGPQPGTKMMVGINLLEMKAQSYVQEALLHALIDTLSTGEAGEDAETWKGRVKYRWAEIIEIFAEELEGEAQSPIMVARPAPTKRR